MKLEALRPERYDDFYRFNAEIFPTRVSVPDRFRFQILGNPLLADRNAPDVTNVTMYHTYYNSTGTLLGFARVSSTGCATEGQWVFRGAGYVDGGVGCEGSAYGAPNGIGVSDATNFYAPMALGPGTPNVVYFGSDRLYRSTNRGDAMSIVSQSPIVAGTPISTIAIAPTDDKVRVVGMDQTGRIFGTTTGSSAPA